MRQKTLKICLILFIIILNIKIANSQPMLLSPDYIGFIQQRVNSYLVFPPEATTKGWEGIVKVKFILIPDGRIKEIDIAESSGYPLLDAIAMLAVKDASPYPFPEDYPEEELEIILPVSYQQPKSLAPQPTPQKEDREILSSSQGKIPLEEPKEVSPGYPQELTYFVETALKNNEPTKVAKEEVELAQLKVIEAQRNLYPNLKILGYTTDGEVYKIDYEEREAKVQLDQPLYYSGRLKDTLRQSKVNLEITQKNYDRLKFDVVHKTETAYYNLVASKTQLIEKQKIREEAKELLEKVERLFSKDMVIPLEVNSARTWFKQIEAQIKSIQYDLNMAELTFKQVLNVQETPQTAIQLLEAKSLDLDLDECLEVALIHRPEIYLSELLVKFNDYGKRIERSKAGFSVDLTSSYGYYDGHYKTEPWRDSTNWALGIKVSKPWGGSTINSGYSSEEIQPRLGQTSPTASSTISAELNLLDNLKRLSDKKRSEIDLSRSLSDFNETFKTVKFEVQDAFLRYKKALFQLDTAELEMRFRRNEIEVTKTRTQVGEASLSSAIESLYSFSEAHSRYIQALANYYLSLATLKKSIGYGLKI